MRRVSKSIIEVGSMVKLKSVLLLTLNRYAENMSE